MAVAKEFDPKLLGGKYTTQQELEANPTALMDRQTALGKGFVGGDAWGDGRYDQYFKGFNQGQSSGSSPVPPQPPVDPYPHPYLIACLLHMDVTSASVDCPPNKAVHEAHDWLEASFSLEFRGFPRRCGVYSE